MAGRVAALDRYDEAKVALRESQTRDEVTALTTVLDEGRFHLACVLARRDWVELPRRREPCFFNPQHGPAVAEVGWTPPGGGHAPHSSAHRTKAETRTTINRAGSGGAGFYGP